MIDQFSFLNDQWFWPVGLGVAILLCIFIWKEWSQSGKRRLVLKSILAFLAIASLAIIALKPMIISAAEFTYAALLTDGYDNGRLDSLEKAHKNLEVIKYEVGTPVLDKEKPFYIVFILGRGLKPFDLWQLNDVPAIYLGGKAPTGVVKLKYDQEYAVGDRLVINGIYNFPRKGTRLVLQGLGGVPLDSVLLNRGKDQDFQLVTDLKVQGKYLFSLVEKDSSNNIITSYPLPVKVNAKKSLKVLVINSFPTFEAKYLKNFLAENGHQVLVRSQVTTGRYKFEYFNMEGTPIGPLSEKSLESFDLLVIDANSLSKLSAGVLGAIKKSVTTGMGVFIQSDDIFFKSPGKLAAFSFIQEKNKATTLDQWPELSVDKSSFYFKDEFKLQTIHSSDGKTISAYQRVGNGKVGTTVLENIYQLQLDGNATAYRQLWSGIIKVLSKKSAPLSEWQSNSFVAFQHQPFDFQLRTSLEDIKVTNDNRVVPIMRDIEVSSLWTGKTYPRQTGWHTIELKPGTTQSYDYYVADTTHWHSVADYEMIKENTRYFDRQFTPGDGITVRKPVNPLWFFLMFMLCVGYLWLEPKLYG